MRSDHEDKLTQNHIMLVFLQKLKLRQLKQMAWPFQNTKWEGMGLTLK